MKEGASATPQRFAFRTGWFVIGVLSLIFATMSWFAGLMSGGLDSKEGCNIVHGQSYDREYRKAHPEHANRNLFPLSDKCNAAYDMVPSWINPAIVGLVLFGVGTTVVLPIRDMAIYVQSR